MKDRIKLIRNNSGKTQAEFAADLGISLSNIQSYETGRRIPSEAFIQLIESKYHINDEWLRTGNGEMIAPASKEQEIAAITAQLFKENDESFRYRLIKLVSQMTDDQLQMCEDLIKKLME